MKKLVIKKSAHKLSKIVALICLMLLFFTGQAFECQLHNGNFTSSVSGDTVRLSKTGTGYTSYIWSYGDGTYGTSDMHIYTSIGMKNICLKLVDSTSSGSCDTTICKQVGITAQPFVCALHNNNYTININGNSVSITLSGTGYTSILVGWGDATYNSSLTHTYTSTGTKTMCVRFRDSTAIGMCDTTICKTITINNSICTWPNLYTSIWDSCTTSNHSVNGYSTLNTCYKYQWKVNGVIVGTTRMLTYPVTQNGTYNVCLAITDTCTHCDTTICSTRTITCIPSTTPCNWQSHNPYVNFWDSCTTTNKSLNGYIYFANTSTCFKYQWKVNGVSAGTTRPFTYPITQNGTYNVCVTVTDTCNHCDTTFCSVRTITCIPTTIPCNWSSRNPYTSFWDSCTTTNKSLHGYITFNSNYSCDKFVWKVNNIVVGSGRTLTYPVTQNGTYNVCVTVTDTCNHCDTTFCSTRTMTCIPLTTPCNWQSLKPYVNFWDSCTTTNKSLNGYIYLANPANTCYKYQWKVNGVLAGTTRPFTYPVTQNGTYNVCVTVTDTCNHCDTTFCSMRTITCFNNWTCPIQGIGFTTQLSGNTVILTQTGSGYSYYTYQYGDGSSGTSHTHTYTTAGVKNICLRYQYVDTTNTSHHCDTTICHTVTIANNFVCPLHNTSFTTSVNRNIVTITLTGSGSNSYIVGWGDATYYSSSTSGTGVSLTHEYSTSGAKTICVKFISSTASGSCDTTVCKEVAVTIPYFTCPIQGVGFTAQVNGNTVTLSHVGNGYSYYTYQYGDGSSGTSNTHTYTTSGVKNICLRYQYYDSTNTAHHCDTTICHTITIAPTFICTLQNPNFTTSINGNTVTITLLGEGYNSHLVGWGDVTYNTETSHTYSSIGVKTICVKFKDSTSLGSCDTTICKNITLTNPVFICPIQGVGFTTQVNGNTVTLSKTGTGYRYYTYTYGDGSSGTSSTHTYTTSGVKEICLRYQYVDTTNTAHHCDTTICHTITIAPTFICTLQNPNFTTNVNGNTVTVTLSGGGYNSYLVGWGDVTYNSELMHIYTSVGIKNICVRFRDSTEAGICDTAICKTITIANLCDSISCVLPGDADHDLTVNNFDIFAIGLSYNRLGIIRPNATTQYTLQPAPDWSSTHYYGFNDKFADCNGDGTIKNTDASVILQNYIVKPINHFNHRLSNQDSLPPVFLAFDSLPIFQIGNPCNTSEITSDINVGTTEQMANNVYGIGFSVDYPESFVSDSCFKIQIDLDANSWFATNEPILYLYKNIPEYHRVDIGIVRTTGVPRSGNGKIGRMKFVVEDGIFINGRTTSTNANKQYTFTVDNVGAVDGNGVKIDMIGKSTSPVFLISGIKTNKIEGLKIYPNPVTNYLEISANEILDEILIIDITGKVVITESINTTYKKLDLNSLDKGMYLLEIHSKNRISTTKIIKAE